MTKALDRSEAETEFENEQDKIFIEMPIPRTLSEIGFLQAEKDIREGKQGTGSTLYGIVTGMKSDMSGTGKKSIDFLKLLKRGASSRCPREAVRLPDSSRLYIAPMRNSDKDSDGEVENSGKKHF